MKKENSNQGLPKDTIILESMSKKDKSVLTKHSAIALSGESFVSDEDFDYDTKSKT